MTEKLIRKYMETNELLTYPNPNIDQISTAGEWVMFRETENSGYYSENHMVKLLDITAWVFSLVES